jgi:hypothetical protein
VHGELARASLPGQSITLQMKMAQCYSCGSIDLQCSQC